MKQTSLIKNGCGYGWLKLWLNKTECFSFSELVTYLFNESCRHAITKAKHIAIIKYSYHIIHTRHKQSMYYLFFVLDLILENRALHQAIWFLAVQHRKTFSVICLFWVHFKKMYLIYYRIASCKNFVKWTGNFDLQVHMIINYQNNYFEIQSDSIFKTKCNKTSVLMRC